jgi:ribosomal-protein-alanine N-acetyltransferase
MTSPKLALSLARIGDAAAIAAMSRDHVEHGLNWAWTPGRVAASIRSRTALVVVARDGVHIAGFGIMRYGDDDAHLDLFCVAPRYRGAGLGRRLLEWLEKPALVAGIGAVFLEVRASNRSGQAFYERLGYRVLARLSGYYQGREAALRMGRELGQREQQPVKVEWRGRG